MKPAASRTKSATTSGRCFAIVGSDEGEVKRAALELAGQLAPAAAGEFARDVVDGATDNVDMAVTRIRETIEALLTLPFFGGDKLVWLKNANFLADDVRGRSESVLGALEKLSETLASLPEGVKFLLSAVDVDKRRSFYKSLSKVGKVQVFDKADASRGGWEEAAQATVIAGARERGLRLAPDAIELFAMFTGGEARQMEIELEKLSLFAHGRKGAITADEVRALVPLSRNRVVFELGNAISERNLPRCLDLLDQLLHQGENAIGILFAAIIPTVRNLLVVKDLMERFKLRPPSKPFDFGASLNRLPEDAVAHLPRKKDGGINAFGLGVAAMNARRYTLDELLRLFQGCLQANVRLVTTQLEPKMVLTELLAGVAKPV